MPALTGYDETLPISLLTGFLGSGKTTFLRRVLETAACADTAVVINEIGAIGLDHYLVETVDGPVLELPGGCLCCAVREDLAATLRGLLTRRDQGSGPKFRRVVIETTGLADPAPILFTLGADAMLDTRLRLDRVVTTVDATTGAGTLARFGEAARQVAMADRLLVTKTDLAPFTGALRDGLLRLNPAVQPLLAADLTDAGALLFGGETSLRPRSWPAPPEGAHTHGVRTEAIVLAHDPSRLDFALALGGLARRRGEDLLRVKGLIRFSDSPGKVAFVQGAQHALYPPTWLADWPDADRRNRLVFVVQDMPLETLLDCFAFAAAAPHRPRAETAKHDHGEAATCSI